MIKNSRIFLRILVLICSLLTSLQIFASSQENVSRMNDLRTSWKQLIMLIAPQVCAFEIDGVFDDIVEHYTEQQRHYHTLEHISEILKQIEEFSEITSDTASVYLAAWLHDIIYDPLKTDNEAQSAMYARNLLDGFCVDPEVVDEVIRLINLTSGHIVLVTDRNGAVLIDADLAILGTDRNRYVRYAEDIRKEYSHLTDASYHAGRIKFLKKMLKLSRLFTTDRCHQELEAVARNNMQWEIEQLETCY